MDRRSFLAAGLSAAAIGGLAPRLAGADPRRVAARPAVPRADAPVGFRLNYAPHFGMFSASAGDDLVDQLRFMADEGFTAFEDNGLAGRPVDVQERLGAESSRLGLTMGVFVAHGNLWGGPHFASGDEAQRERFLADLRRSIDVAKRVNAKWMTVVPGESDRRLEPGYQTANVVETLRRGAELLEPEGLVMVLEPLNPWRDHPGMFLQEIPQAWEICRAVDSPACKILFDIYHQQITEGNLIPNINQAWDEIGYFQVGDNPGRNEPGTGEINYRNVFRHIHGKGFAGVLGMEHGNSRGGVEGERAVIDAYRAADAF